MACNYPVRAFRLKDGSVVFDRSHEKNIVKDFFVPCGQCMGCKLERSRQWAIRCMHESSLHERNCFITLTYNDAHLPDFKNLEYSQFQLFMKRLRKKFDGKKIRFFMCGEYGDRKDRPHFHACLFGHDFDDKILYKQTAAGPNLYTSKTLDALWSDKKGVIGFTTIGDVTFESAAYVARYIIKKGNGKNSSLDYQEIDVETGELFQKTKEFNRMSLKPGVGSDFYKKWKSDMFPLDVCVVNGVATKPPQYYFKKLKIEDPQTYEDICYARETRAKENSADNTDERLYVKEAVLTAKITLLSRELK